MTAGTWSKCATRTDSGGKCARLGSYTVDGLLFEPKCRQHALIEARARGGRLLVNLRDASLVNIDMLPEPRRRTPKLIDPPTDAEAILAAAETATSLKNLHIVILAACKEYDALAAYDQARGFRGKQTIKNRILTAIGESRKRLKKTASATDLAIEATLHPSSENFAGGLIGRRSPW